MKTIECIARVVIILIAVILTTGTGCVAVEAGKEKKKRVGFIVWCLIIMVFCIAAAVMAARF